MIDNTTRPETDALLARAPGYTFRPDVDNDDSVFAPNGTRVGGVYPVIPTGWRGQSMLVGTTDPTDTPLEAAVLLAEAHIEMTKPKRVERELVAGWAVISRIGIPVAVTAFKGDAERLAAVLDHAFSRNEYSVVQFDQTTLITFDTKN